MPKRNQSTKPVTSFARLGIETQYVDAFGRRRVADRAVLAQIADAISATDIPAPRLLPRTLVFRLGQDALTLPLRAGLRWEIFSDHTCIASGATDTVVDLPRDLPAGAYRLRVNSRGRSPKSEDALVLVAPEKAFQGGKNHPRRMWALAVQLYSVRSHRNWGHGDFTDLLGLIELASDLGASGIALNPIHALFDDRLEHASPYSPNSRMFLNPLYIDVEGLPEFPGLSAAGMEDDVASLRKRELIDYVAVAKAKMRGLQIAYEHFCRQGSKVRRAEFETFRRARGTTLTRFACFELLRRRYNQPWWEWPLPWRKPDDRSLAELRRSNSHEIGFFEFLQWSAEQQLHQCSARARSLAMPIGLFLDIAVGVQPDGFDAWDEQDAILRTIAVGAPPDALNRAGQNWGLAGFNPVGLQTRRFEPFRRMLQASMQFAGAIRLDHVLGLNRLYVIPEGRQAHEGAYLRLPFEGLLAIIAQESVRHRCIVIGEDLGTVPAGLRDTLGRWGIWSYQMMLFERTAQGAFVPPERYRENALVSFATHDLPTFAGWMSDKDLAVKKNLAMEPGETDEDRRSAQAALRDALSTRGIGSADFAAVASYLAATPSRLLVVSMEDMLGLEDQVNLPGTIDEHPNWRRRSPIAVEELSSVRSVMAVADVMKSAGR